MLNTNSCRTNKSKGLLFTQCSPPFPPCNWPLLMYLSSTFNIPPFIQGAQGGLHSSPLPCIILATLWDNWAQDSVTSTGPHTEFQGENKYEFESGYSQFPIWHSNHCTILALNRILEYRGANPIDFSAPYFEVNTHWMETIDLNFDESPKRESPIKNLSILCTK